METLPSSQIVDIDIPNYEDQFNVQFVYNFFVEDEMVNTVNDSQLNSSLNNKISSTNQNVYEQSYLKRKVPRYVKIQICNTLQQAGKNSQAEIYYTQLKSLNGLIKSNLDRLIDEDVAATFRYYSVNYYDVSTDARNNYVISGSYTMLKAIDAFAPISQTKTIQQQFLNALSPKAHNEISNKYNNYDQNAFINLNVKVNSQLLSKVIDDNNSRFVVNTNMNTNTPIDNLQGVGINSFQLSEADYRLILKPISVATLQHGNVQISSYQTNLVGYVITKKRINSDGTYASFEQLTIETPDISTIYDTDILFGAVYEYTISSVYKIDIPAIDILTGEGVYASFLFKSKQSSTKTVICDEMIPPKPPTNLMFIWDNMSGVENVLQYDQLANEYVNSPTSRGRLIISWSFPIGTQLDVKQFQIFRKKKPRYGTFYDIPYELIKVYNFDNSVIPMKSDDNNVDAKLIEKMLNPKTFFVDEEFDKNSDYAYTICAVDAHGYTSNYSSQFEVWFDQTSEKLKKRLLSIQGAPKAYPNIYANFDMFNDLIRVNGPRATKFDLYFNPEVYKIQKGDDIVDTIATIQDNVLKDDNTKRYLIDVVNTDTATGCNTSVYITTQNVVSPIMSFAMRQ